MALANADELMVHEVHELQSDCSSATFLPNQEVENIEHIDNTGELDAQRGTVSEKMHNGELGGQHWPNSLDLSNESNADDSLYANTTLPVLDVSQSHLDDKQLFSDWSISSLNDSESFIGSHPIVPEEVGPPNGFEHVADVSSAETAEFSTEVINDDFEEVQTGPLMDFNNAESDDDNCKMELSEGDDSKLIHEEANGSATYSCSDSESDKSECIAEVTKELQLEHDILEGRNDDATEATQHDTTTTRHEAETTRHEAETTHHEAETTQHEVETTHHEAETSQQAVEDEAHSSVDSEHKGVCTTEASEVHQPVHCIVESENDDKQNAEHVSNAALVKTNACGSAEDCALGASDEHCPEHCDVESANDNDVEVIAHTTTAVEFSPQIDSANDSQHTAFDGSAVEAQSKVDCDDVATMTPAMQPGSDCDASNTANFTWPAGVCVEKWENAGASDALVSHRSDSKADESKPVVFTAEDEQETAGVAAIEGAAPAAASAAAEQHDVHSSTSAPSVFVFPAVPARAASASDSLRRQQSNPNPFDTLEPDDEAAGLSATRHRSNTSSALCDTAACSSRRGSRAPPPPLTDDAIRRARAATSDISTPRLTPHFRAVRRKAAQRHNVPVELTDEVYDNFLHSRYEMDKESLSAEQRRMFESALLNVTSGTSAIGERLAQMSFRLANEPPIRDQLDSLCGLLNVGPQTTAEMYNEVMANIAQRMFDKGPDLTQILMLFAFGYRLALALVRQMVANCGQVLRQVSSAVVSAVRRYYTELVQRMGGWAGVLDYDDSDPEDGPRRVTGVLPYLGFLVLTSLAAYILWRRLKPQ